MMKLVLATPLYPPEIGGPATYAQALVEGLPARGIAVSLVKFSDVRRLPKLVRHVAYYRKVLAAAKDADIVLALDPVSAGLPARRAAKEAGKPFLVKIVGDYAWEQGRQRFGVTQELDDFVRTKQPSVFVRKLQTIEKDVAMSATNIIVPSPYLRGIVLAWGVPEGNIQVIHNAVDLPERVPAQAKKPGEFLVVSAGRRVPWKGFEALARVAQGHPDWRVFIASGLSREETLGWMKAADVFVLNSSYEGFPHALVEAMALGTPAVATDIIANRYVVETTVPLVPPGDDRALEQALVAIQKNPEAARERARAAEARAKEFTLPRMLDATADLLKRSV